MAYGKIKMGSARSAQGERKSQSKVNPALSYGERTGKTYVNKEKVNKTMPKKPIPGGRTISAQKRPIKPRVKRGR